MANKNDSLMHIRIDYDGARNSKKDLLTTEISVIKAVQTLHAYKALKLQEYEAKAKLQEKIKEARLTLLSLERVLPKVKLPKMLENEEEQSEKQEKIKKETKDVPRIKIRQEHGDPLETQLREIQEKLSKLG